LAILFRGCTISPHDYGRQRLYFLFDRSRMDLRWLAEGEPPAKCGTLVLADIAKGMERLDQDAQALYRRYTGGAEVAAATNSYNTTHFHIEYDSSGPDAPPSEDVAPANGVPDFVERTAEAGLANQLGGRGRSARLPRARPGTSGPSLHGRLSGAIELWLHRGDLGTEHSHCAPPQLPGLSLQ
jgi:hypothetical protein